MLKQAVLLFLLLGNLMLFGQDEIRNYYSVGIANSLLLAGEQNATYDIIHTIQLDYSHAVNEKITVRPQLGYSIAPYNQNFKLTSFQALTGLEYRFSNLTKALILYVGYEYALESYAFKFQESVLRNEMASRGLIIKGALSFTVVDKVKLQPFIEFIPNLRTGIGIRLSYQFLKQNHDPKF